MLENNPERTKSLRFFEYSNQVSSFLIKTNEFATVYYTWSFDENADVQCLPGQITEPSGKRIFYAFQFPYHFSTV
jgi:hypothetical protein